MNERIKQLARQSGATDENGSRATGVFCFTEQELNGFAELIVRECALIAGIMEHEDRKGIGAQILDSFGVE